MDVEEIEKAIDGLEEFPLTETQQRLVNYLRANRDDIAEALETFDEGDPIDFDEEKSDE